MGSVRDDGGSPWASLLDPVANVRVLGDVQAQALRAAGDLVERIAAAVDGAPERADDPGAPANGSSTGGRDDAAREVARLVETWVEILSGIARGFGRGDTAGDGRVELELDGTGPGPVVRLDARVGGPTATEVWLANGPGGPVGPLTVHAGPFVDADGGTLAATVTVDPTHIEELPARSSRGVVVGVAPSPGSAPGTYRGLLQVAGVARCWAPLEVCVTTAEPA